MILLVYIQNQGALLLSLYMLAIAAVVVKQENVKINCFQLIFFIIGGIL